MKKEIILQNASNEEVKNIVNIVKENRKNLLITNNNNGIIIKYYDNDSHDDDNKYIKDIIKKHYPHISIEKEILLPTIRRVLYLDGLDCPNCAAKVERISKRTLDHENIVVDFATTRFIIETTDKDLIDNLVSTVQKITSKVDAQIKVKTKAEYFAEKEKDTIPKSEKLFFIFGVSLFIIGVIVRYSLLEFGIKIPSWGVIIMYTIAYALLGKDIIYSAIKNIISGRIFDEKFLMTIATLGALGIGYYEEAVSVMIFYKIGEMFQEHAVNKSRHSIASLLDIKPEFANLIVEGELKEVDPIEVVSGDIILIRPGERVPLDGVIIEGEAALDVSALTGEAKYLDVGSGDNVISGSININGTLKVKVLKPYQESMVAKILDMVENASSLKSKSENYISKFARYYTPAICLFAIFVALLPFFTKTNPVWNDFQESIYAAMIFLVASCPCALVISIPLGFFGGIGGASRHGILVKGSNYLEALSNVDTVIFDKTGTLTKGTFKVEKINPISCTKEELLMYAAYAEVTSNHPIAKSIVNLYGSQNIDISRVKSHPEQPKSGNRIFLDCWDIIAANDYYLQKLKIKYKKFTTEGVVVHIVKDMEYQGYIVMKDEVRPEAKEAISELKEMKINTLMFTGDKELEARGIAKEVGINHVYYNMNPIDKVEKLQQLKSTKKQEGLKQAFIGDGINDAPVLSSADIGIAMGGLGSDAAIKVADVILMNDDLTKLPMAIKISKKTKRIVLQNIVFALVVKLIVLSLAPLGLSKMWEAIFADVGVSLIAILNSLRAAKIKR